MASVCSHHPPPDCPVPHGPIASALPVPVLLQAKPRDEGPALLEGVTETWPLEEEPGISVPHFHSTSPSAASLGLPETEFASAFWQGTPAPGAPGMAVVRHPAPGSRGRARRQRAVDVTHGWLRSGKNGAATCACPGSRAAAPTGTRQHRSDCSPGRGRQHRQAANLRGRGRKGGKEHAGGRKTPDLSKLQPPLARLASPLKHFHFQRNQPIQSSEERSSAGLQAGPAKGSCRTPTARNLPATLPTRNRNRNAHW